MKLEVGRFGSSAIKTPHATPAQFPRDLEFSLRHSATAFGLGVPLFFVRYQGEPGVF
jgi:hypothetical protein